MLRFRRAPIAFAIVSLVSACSSPDPSGQPDAGTDGSRPDSGKDSGLDAGDDAPIVFDAGPTWFPPGDWDQPFLGQGCSARVAKDPNATIPNWVYQPCAGNVQGCEEAPVDWMKGITTVPPLGSDRRPVQSVNGKTLLKYRREYPAVPTDKWALVDVIQELDGARLVAVGDSLLGNPIHCTAEVVPSTAGVSWTLRPSTPSGITNYVVGLAPWLTPSQPSTLKTLSKADLGVDKSGYINETSASQGISYFGVVAPTTVVTFDPNNGGKVTIPPQQIYAESMREVPDGVLALSSDAPYGVRLIRADATQSTLLATAGDAVAIALYVDPSANPMKVVWVEARFSGGCTDGKLYTATYDTSVLTPTLVTKLPVDFDSSRGLAVYGGYAVISRAQGLQARVIRLSDGMGWEMSAPPGRAISDPIWVDADHVWFFSSDPKIPNYAGYPTAIWRQSRTAWGPPTVPASL
ncbi:MAG TPA: hypothetical protein VF316_16225 [Polyangiaceae bacterium]